MLKNVTNILFPRQKTCFGMNISGQWYKLTFIENSFNGAEMMLLAY